MVGQVKGVQISKVLLLVPWLVDGVCILDQIRAQLAVRFAVLFPHLVEGQRCLLMAAEARVLGHSGVRASRGRPR